MKIAIGSDHRGVRLKRSLIRYLEGKGIHVRDQGPYSEESCDYPLFARKVARQVATGKSDFGILICNSGIGMEMAANKLKKIRAANCTNLSMARFSREHNNANVLVMGAAFVNESLAKRMVGIWLKTVFAGGRHARRVTMFSE